MKKLFKKAQNQMIKATIVGKNILRSNSGEGTVSQAISILTAVVLGSLLLMGLYKLIGDIVLPELQERIMEMFNFAG